MSAYLNVAVAVLATAILLVLEHWLVFTVRQRPLDAPVSYVAGSAAVWCGFALWGVLAGNMLPVAVLATIYLLAGGLLILMHLAEQARDGQGHRAEAAALRGVVRDGQE